MKNILLVFLFSISFFGFAQKSAKAKSRTIASADLMFGQKLLFNNSFSGELNTIEDARLFRSIMYTGIGMTGNFIVNRKYKYSGHMYYAQVLPQAIKINDTISARLTGFNLGFSVAGFDVFRKQQSIDLFLSAGFNMGRLRLYGNSYVKQKNPYVSPKISIAPRFKLKRICLQMNIDCDIDLSKKNWRRTYFSKSPKINLPKTSTTGLILFFSVGYVLA